MNMIMKLFILLKIVARRKTIYEYHRVNLDGQEIQNHTMIHLSALPTCNLYTECVTCTNNQEPFKVSII